MVKKGIPPEMPTCEVVKEVSDTRPRMVARLVVVVVVVVCWNRIYNECPRLVARRSGKFAICGIGFGYTYVH